MEHSVRKLTQFSPFFWRTLYVHRPHRQHVATISCGAYVRSWAFAQYHMCASRTAPLRCILVSALDSRRVVIFRQTPEKKTPFPLVWLINSAIVKVNLYQFVRAIFIFVLNKRLTSKLQRDWEYYLQGWLEEKKNK